MCFSFQTVDGKFLKKSTVPHTLFFFKPLQKQPVEGPQSGSKFKAK